MGNLTRGLINIIGSTAQRRATSCYSKFNEKKKKKKTPFNFNNYY